MYVANELAVGHLRVYIAIDLVSYKQLKKRCALYEHKINIFSWLS